MNKSDLKRNLYMLEGSLGKQGYDWWWHSFTAYERKTGKEKAFFIEYYVCNPIKGDDKPIFKPYPSYCMVKVGTWGENKKEINNFYGINEFKYNKDKLDIKIKNCTLTENHMKGSCTLTKEESLNNPDYMSDYGSVSWDINISKQIAYNVGYGASSIFRKLNMFEMFWHAEGIKTEYSGTITFDGVVYDIIKEKSYGYADKNWGKDFTSPWLWISSCNLVSKLTGKKLDNSALEIGGGRPKVMGFPLNRKILVALYYQGNMYEYNFSKFWSPSKSTFSFEEGETFNTWKVISSNNTSELDLTLKCKKNNMIFINYVAPNGKKLHNRLWNGGDGVGELKLYKKSKGKKELIDIIEIKNAGCEYGEYE